MKSFSEAIRYKPNRVLHSVYASDYGSWYKPQTVHQARKGTHFVQETMCEECCYIQCWKGVPRYILSQKTGSWHTCLRLLTVNVIMPRSSFWDKVILVHEIRSPYQIDLFEIQVRYQYSKNSQSRQNPSHPGFERTEVNNMNAISICSANFA